MTDVQRTIAQNIGRIRERIAAAADRAGRSAANIRLVAVTKYASTEAARAIALAGLKDLGESRPQQLWEKAAILAHDTIHWHLVGHLQRNKVARTVPLTSMIHSVDSLRLMEEISRQGSKHDRHVAVLLEINISEDDEKHGFTPKELATAIEATASFTHLEVRGLMAMAHRDGGPEVARKDFANVRELRDRLAGSVPAGASLDELSLGMSDDFEEAILEGATIVRVGRALFEGLEN
jgi:pyridoxal phosphate enzyme (YggS family)